MQRMLIGAMVGATLVAGMPAFAQDTDRSALMTAHRGGKLTLLAPGFDGSIDPQIAYDELTWQIHAVVYDQLLTFQKADGEASNVVVPDLAEALPEVSDDGRTLTFKLRRGIRFSNGAEVTTADVRASFERMFKVASPTSDKFYTGIVGADACVAERASCSLEKVIEIDQTFGNFTWNSPSQSTSFNLSGNLTTVNGNLRVQNSGTGQLRFTGASTMNLIIGGSFAIEDDLNIDSDVSGTSTIELVGNFSHTAGTFQSATDIVTITMTGAGRTFTQSGGTYNGANIDWIINSGADVTVLNGLTISASRSLTVDGTLIAAATVTNNGTTNINNIFQINEGGWGTGTGFVYDPAATLVFNNTSNYDVNDDAYWPAASGPTNVTVQNTGGITMNVARTVSGLFQTMLTKI